MKAIVALAALTLALSFCNLLGKRANTNDNANSRSSGTSSESSASPSPARNEIETSAAPRDVGSAPPPSKSGPQAPGSSKADMPPPPPPRPSPPKIISGGVLNGKAISKPQPAYPPIARAAHASGLVTVQVTVDENGRVISATAVSGHPLLQQSAVNAARQAKFSPTVLSGQPVKVTGVLTYNFVAQ